MKKKQLLPMLKYIFPKTIPVLTGYLFLGMAYGIYMSTSGLPFWYSILTSVIVFGGSLEFVCVSMLLQPFAPAATFLMAIMVQARHIFYGIAMLDKYKGTGIKKFYLIYALSDETFSVNYTLDIPPEYDKGNLYFLVALLDQIYWVIGVTIGSLLGTAIPFNTTGIEFVMTAMFVVIFLNQWLKDKKHYTALIGLAATIICRLGFGRDNFLIPTMICILVILSIFMKPLTKKGGVEL